MKIYKIRALKETDNRVCLVRKDGDLSGLIPDKKQRQYVEKRFAAGKESAQINLLDHQIFIRRLENEDRPLPKRLEEARTAAESLQTSMNDLDIDKLMLVNGGVSAEEVIAFAEGV